MDPQTLFVIYIQSNILCFRTELWVMCAVCSVAQSSGPTLRRLFEKGAWGENTEIMKRRVGGGGGRGAGVNRRGLASLEKTALQGSHRAQLTL